MSGEKSTASLPMNDRRQQIQDDDYAFPYHYVPQFREGYTHTYSWPWGLYYVSAMEFVLKKVADLGPRSVADVGTGDGRLVRELALSLPGVRVTGIDYSARAIQLAKALNPDLDFRCSDIITEGVGQLFDVVTLIEVFEHIPPDLNEPFVAALRKLVSDDGMLLVTVPHRNVRVSKKHFQHFSAESLEAHFRTHFDREEVAFLDKRSRVVAWLRWLLENPYFILKHWGIRNRLYLFYKRRFLVTDEGSCGRVFMRFRPRARGSS
ncbi:MAG: class I SAM-dependent methyltransferase [Burkholderiaceae bacterium]|nr:class I SAM-dependent methyltransferase [Burkholderiaceae bacterium]